MSCHPMTPSVQRSAWAASHRVPASEPARPNNIPAAAPASRSMASDSIRTILTREGTVVFGPEIYGAACSTVASRAYSG